MRRPARPHIPLRIPAAALLCLLLTVAPCRPEDPPIRRGPYRLGTADAFLIPLALGTGAYGQYRYAGMGSVDTSALDRNRDLWAFDRWSAGTYSPAAAWTSDAIIAPLFVAPAAAALWEKLQGRESWSDAIAEAAAYGEALVFSAGLALWIRSLRVHPRPLAYSGSAPAKERMDPDAAGSFYSGHANTAFLAATWFSRSFSLRHPGHPANAWVWAGAYSAATGVAALRVAAGKHYLSDVIAGAAAGTGAALLFSTLHLAPRGGAANPGLSVGPDGGPRLTWTF